MWNECMYKSIINYTTEATGKNCLAVTMNNKQRRNEYNRYNKLQQLKYQIDSALLIDESCGITNKIH